MILWFVGLSCLIVLLVFGDPRIDYRLIAVGSLLPDAPLTVTPLHSLTAGALALVVVMLATRRGNPVRRRLLAIPIGMLLHLVLDGSTDGLWWPDGGRLPSFERPLALLAVMELAGAAALYWSWARLSALREASSQ